MCLYYLKHFYIILIIIYLLSRAISLSRPPHPSPMPVFLGPRLNSLKPGHYKTKPGPRKENGVAGFLRIFIYSDEGLF